jgi:CheY-like chemotaxis protein
MPDRMPDRILVVDDDEDIRESLIAYLEDNGYRPIGAVNGRHALDLLSDPDLRPSLIVLDLMMPVMDGRAFREAQLQSPLLSNIPVILISAYDSAVGLAKSLGIGACLLKPIDPDLFLRFIKEQRRVPS